MKITFASDDRATTHRAKRLILLLLHITIFSFIDSTTFASGETISVNGNSILVSEGMFSFIKISLIVAGSYITLFAAIGITFFGWDIRKAKSSMHDELGKFHLELQQLKAQVEEAKMYINAKFTESKEMFKTLEDAKNRLEEIGAHLEETKDMSDDAGVDDSYSSQSQNNSDYGKSKSENNSTKSTHTRSDLDLIKDIMSSSKYTWTTIKRIQNKTGLSRETILKLTRSDPGIVISIGKDSKDHIFKFR